MRKVVQTGPNWAVLAVLLGVTLGGFLIAKSNHQIFSHLGGERVVSLPAPSSAPRLVRLPDSRAALAVRPSDVVEGDTLRVHGVTYRLVGFDTPETGRNARCAYERDLGNRATVRLQELLRDASSVDLGEVRCACRPGTHGTRQCNFGRSCATLRVDGRDVGHTLIGEGLARSYVCGSTGCPPRRQWC